MIARHAPVHQAFGAFTVRAPFVLPSLPAAAEGLQQFRIDLDWAESGMPGDTVWAHHWVDGDDVLLSLALREGGYWLRVPGQADFLIHLQPARIQIWPTITPAPDAATLEHLLVDQILPRVLAQLGGSLIHASTVRIGSRHVLFLGPSGWGKSTLAGLLYRAGHRVLSDDCVQLVAVPGGRFHAVPTYPSLRLNADSLAAVFPGQIDTAPVASYSNKRRIPIASSGHIDALATVDAIYLLGDPAQDGDVDEVRIEPAHPAAVCLALIRHSFRLDLADRDASAAQLRQCGAIASAVPGFELHYPRDHARSDDLLEALFVHLATLPPSQPMMPATVPTPAIPHP